MNRWLLPEDIADILPAEAAKVEALRRLLLDLYKSYGVNLHPKLTHHLHLILTHLKVYSKCFYLWITSLFLPPLLV